MSGFGLAIADFKRFVLLNINNRLGHDVRDKVLPELEKFGGYDGICEKLQTSVNGGIQQSEVQARQEAFGRNYVEQAPLTPFLVFCLEALKDPTLIFLCFASLVSIIIGTAFEPPECLGWLDGMAIMCAVAVVVFVGAAQESAKERQFRDLTDKAGDDLVNLIRGGVQVRVSNREVVVGDVLVLSTGDIIVADGLVFERNTLKIFEGALTGESHAISKGNYEFKEKGHFSVPPDLDLQQMNVPGDTPEARAAKYEPTPDKTPLVFKGTEVQDGEGKMLVIAVGLNTYEQILMEDKGGGDDDDEGGRSILQVKLDDMTIMITKIGACFGIGIIIILFIRFAVLFSTKACCKEEWDNAVHNSQWITFLITGITIFVVAVPEGLPLAVTIALAFSVKKMMTDMNMVKTSSACETMGSATTICSDKTGTLTTGKMSVVKMMVCGKVVADPKATTEELPGSVGQLLARAMVINTSFKSDVELDDAGEVKKYAGNDTECAMLYIADRMLTKAGDSKGYCGVREANPIDDENRVTLSFSSDRKRMSTLVKDKEAEGGLRLFTKGASEIVLGLCSRALNEDMSTRPIDDATIEMINRCIGEFADQGLRTLTIAYRDMSAVPEDRESMENDLVLIGLIGLEDPVRAEVPDAVATCQAAGIVVRMVTGDNPRTAAAIARKCGILTDELFKASEFCVMTGIDFRERVVNADETINQKEFDKIWPHLRVLARSSPLDKLTLVTGIQNSRVTTPQTVAVTGDGTNDAPALKRADVGFAMGQTGTQVAQNAADIIVMDDNFASIVMAVKWGRCVYDNICKFLQFQLTVNLTACAIAVVGASILTESPLNVIQLLWVNMIMDSFASVALATEDPRPDLLTRAPYPRDQPLLSQRMIRSLVGHACYQMLLLFVIIFAVGDVCAPNPLDLDTCLVGGKVYKDNWGILRSGRPVSFDQQYYTYDETCIAPFDDTNPKTFTFNETSGNMEKVPNRPEHYCSQEHASSGLPSRHFTILFTTFVLMQLFNQINARKIHGEQNVFVGILENKYFLVIMGMEFFMQMLMVETPGVNLAMGCKGLTFGEWVLCLVLGASELPANFLVSMMPLNWFQARKGIKGFDSRKDDKVDGAEVRPGKEEHDEHPMLEKQ
mmetsp:Transcript_31673/g.77666  ORF Transcript_31673/g.77666 Transcript_31673/m.77666 type:complete len:1129 (-) Transcript_31673:386-3772(-)